MLWPNIERLHQIKSNPNQCHSGLHRFALTLQPNAQVYRSNAVSSGQVVSMTFGVGTTTSNASFGLETGDWNSGTYHRFGVWQKDGQLLLHLFRNSAEVQRTVLMPTVAANTWYVLELAVDDAAGFRATVWAESAPSVRYEMRWEMPTGQQTWRFHAWGSGSTVTSLDTYQEGRSSLKAADVRVAGAHYEDDRGPTPSVTKRYYAEGKLLATRTGATLTYVQSNHLGSTSTLTDVSGAVVGRERYSAFGERRRSDNLALTDRLYTGQQYNSLSGLYHYSDSKSPGRFYDPLLGRFVQPDPLLPHLASQGLNRYAPNYNNPLRYKDPDGHDPWDVINGANEFAQGFVSQVGYNNAAFLPASQAQLAPCEGESDAMTAGRVVGDVVSVGQAVAEGSGGAGLIAGGGVLAVAGSETVVGGVAGAAGVAVGAGMVVHAGSVATAAGSHIGIWMAKTNNGGTGSSTSAIEPPGPGTRSQLRRNMERAGITPPTGMSNPQAHHNLPFKYREWFAGKGRGINVNDARWGRWVDGTPPGSHQVWTSAYEREWDAYIARNPEATREQVVGFLDQLLNSGRFPDQ
ncbi:MAG: RHS repeat-associated core domain-containing protein [Anaerolineae bacterium]